MRGKVVDENTSQPVSNAIVTITSLQDMAAQTFSNENGEFLFEKIAVDSVIDITISAFKEDFTTDTITLLAAPERELIVPDFKIRNLQIGQNGDNGDPAGNRGSAKAIQLVSIGSTILNIAETGGGTSSSFTFVVLDSTDTPLRTGNAIDVLLGDKFSNPVKPETPAYFNTNGGVIQDSGLTDGDGQIQVDLIVGNPLPPNGFATLHAHTFDENENQISRETIVLFSGPPNPSFVNLIPNNFNFLPEEKRDYTLTITDSNGNPLPAGTAISIETNDDIEIVEDSFEVPSTLLTGRNRTVFVFTATAAEEFSGSTTFKITITAPAN